MAIARTPEEEQAVKDSLISICAEVFLRDGYSNVTMKSLSEEAGCTTGKFYSNFTGKPEILRILIGKLVRMNYKEAAKLMTPEDAPMMQMIYFFLLEYEICHVNEKLCELFYYAYEDSDGIREVAELMKPELGRLLKESYGKKEEDGVLMAKSAMNFNILRSIIVGERIGYGFGDEQQQIMTLADTIMASTGIDGKNAEKIRAQIEKQMPAFRDATYNLIIRILQNGIE
ncbi:MAG: TetR/AcrR family transcriptional regulator [Lachnospiraceae bacterium]|nr:TetR/AcrR family transcriptional regulator [Lachnospiraceae bacterium]MBR7021026.1 TetR/AcrR family transcriptional regulator [Lachnospiraceae bacterium]